MKLEKAFCILATCLRTEAPFFSSNIVMNRWNTNPTQSSIRNVTESGWDEKFLLQENVLAGASTVKYRGVE